MNILPEQSDSHKARLNDLNGTQSVVSNEDNTHYLYSNNFGACRRKAIHKRTLSSFVGDIQETKRCSKSGTNGTINVNDENCESVQDDDSNTFRKTTYEDETDFVRRRPSRRNQAHRQYVQHGDENIMFVYESKESKSKNYYKQFGDKNIMVHLNVNFNSNLCQLIGENDGYIPLDTEGEVWLEIKRRSRVRGERDDVSMSPSSHNGNVHGACSPDTDSHVNVCFRNNNVRRKADGRMSPTEHNLDQRFPTEHDLGRRSPTEHNLGRRSPTEQTDSMCTQIDYMYTQNDNSYNTLSILEQTNSLKIKFSKYNQDSVLDIENLNESPIMSHEKVIDFLTDSGNDFDVTIHDWEYQTESLYSYIPATPVDKVNSGFYYETDYLPLQTSNRSVDEHDDSTFYPSTDDPEDDTETYSIPLKEADLTSHIDKFYRALPKVPSQNSPESKQSVNISGGRNPNLYPRKNGVVADGGKTCVSETSDPLLSPTIKSPVARCPIHPDEPRPPLPARMPINSQNEVPDATPPPLPERPAGIPHPPRPRSVTRTPFKMPNETDVPVAHEKIPSDMMRNPSPRERRERILPPLSTRHVKNYLFQYPWYHGKLLPGAGKNILAEEEHGSFLLRDSNDNSDQHKYTIEFRDGNDIKKLMILKTNDKYHFSDFKDKTFDSVEHLIETIIATGLEVKDSDTNSWKTIKVKPTSAERPT